MGGVVSGDLLFSLGLYVYVLTGDEGCVSRLLGLLGVSRDRVAGFIGRFERVLGEHGAGLRERLSRSLYGDKKLYKMSLKKISGLESGDKDALLYSLLWIQHRCRLDSGYCSEVDPGSLAVFSSVMLSKTVDPSFITSLYEETILGVKCSEKIILFPHTWRIAGKLAPKKKIPGLKNVYKVFKDLGDEDHLVPLIYRAYTGTRINKLLYEKAYGVEPSEAIKWLEIKGIIYRGRINDLINQAITNAAKKISIEKADEILKEMHRVFKKTGIRIKQEEKSFSKETLCTQYQAYYEDKNLGVHVCPYIINTPHPTGNINLAVMKGSSPRIHEYLIQTPRFYLENTIWIYIVGRLDKILLITKNTYNPLINELFEKLSTATTSVFKEKTLAIKLPYTRSRLLNPVSLVREVEKDVEQAVEKLVIISPFLKKNVVEEYTRGGVLAKALENKVSVIVVTLKPSSRGIRRLGEERVREQEECIKILQEKGVGVVLRDNIHFKAILVDDYTAYIGSINFLSTTPSRGVRSRDYMVRIEDRDLVEEIEKAIGFKR